ncbi:MAG: DJ-1/PfpI/YhbO family deglycase/protease [Chloroflexi bacterium]|nr:DJ-1/PfpI/YhbO family deglycase/protease [Chloroflexota bacterium]
MTLKGKRVAVLAEEMYQELELWYPTLRMREAGAEVKIVGTGSSPTYASKHGYPVTVDVPADQVSAADFDAVIIPGGYAPDRMRRYPAVLKLVREAFEQGKVIAAICHAGWVPISAGILKGRRVTSFFAIKDDMINAGATWVDEPVVRDGNLITSRMPDDLPYFCSAIIQALGGGEVSADIVETTTAKEALAIAVRAEEQAAAFYKAAVKRTQDPEAKAMFEELAREELGHKARLEKEYVHLSGDPNWARYVLWSNLP